MLRISDYYLEILYFCRRLSVFKNKGKEQDIELIKTNDFFDKLKTLNVTKTIELEENLRKLLCLSPEKQDFIMVKKLIKVLEIFNSSR